MFIGRVFVHPTSGMSGATASSPVCAVLGMLFFAAFITLVVIARARLGHEPARVGRALRLVVVAFRIDRHDGLLVSFRERLCAPGRMFGILEHRGKGART